MLLLDERYCRPGVRARLPTWIGDQFAVAASAADAEDRVRAVRQNSLWPPMQLVTVVANESWSLVSLCAVHM